ncbi:Spherulation-specific family 4 [Roridomyces roridus]|uniref:Spherulation-specific family 4 n=1 Tax=Roridomyces roridus TaxID=1738132 RepID=A0AAD7BPW8_9AGAR|nr:Spherulation-specific family 4 [Roridomyces roridus]
MLFSALSSILLLVTAVYAKTGVIVPLYSYPSTTSTWGPLTTAMTNNPNTQFYIIVNPASGPGSANSQPDTSYQAAITTLRSHFNAILLGYVYTSYGARAVADVQTDIKTYTGWSSAYGVQGIFFDETEAGLTAQYTAYTDAVRAATFTGISKGYIFLNPGTNIGNSDYYSIADQIVTFEDSYASYQSQAPLPVVKAAQQSVIIHSFTADSSLSTVVSALKSSGFGSVYITNLNIANTDVYAAFGSDFATFTTDVNA